MSRIHVALVVTTVLVSCGGSGARTGAPAAPTPLDDSPFETVGGLALGEPVAKVRALLGAPARREDPEEEGASGNFVSSWSWPAKGIDLVMAAPTADGAPVVGAITIASPSAFTTSRGIGVGSPRAQVELVYRGHIQPSSETCPREPSCDRIIVGTEFGGTIFYFADDKVVQIFVGAAAE